MNLITGSAGFIGSRLALRLSSEGESIRCMRRVLSGGVDEVLGDLEDFDSLRIACEGVENIFHCAGYAHAFPSQNNYDAARHWTVNFHGTNNLLRAAGEAGVKRFVYLSSVKAMADPGEFCVSEEFAGVPSTVYGCSKLAAEQSVISAGKLYGMHVANLRLAMVYGHGGRGNLERMGQLVGRRLFPPLPETGNHRSLVHVNDAVSAICLAAKNPNSAYGTYIVASQEAPSGRELFNALRLAHGLKPCSWSFPVSALSAAAKAADHFGSLLNVRLPFGGEVLERLLRSAWYSPLLIERDLGWRATVSLNDGLSEMLHL